MYSRYVDFGSMIFFTGNLPTPWWPSFWVVIYLGHVPIWLYWLRFLSTSSLFIYTCKPITAGMSSPDKSFPS